MGTIGVLNVEADADAGTDTGRRGLRGRSSVHWPVWETVWVAGWWFSKAWNVPCSGKRRRNGPYLEWKGRISVHLG